MRRKSSAALRPCDGLPLEMKDLEALILYSRHIKEFITIELPGLWMTSSLIPRSSPISETVSLL